MVVIHCTELPDLAMAREYAEKVLYDSGTGNCGHYYVDRNGDVLQWVDPAFVAHHVKGHNLQSIGIELVNSGRYPDWHVSTAQTPSEPYPKQQIDGLVGLLQHLQLTLPNLKHVAGHEDLDQTRIPASDNPQVQIARKIDPGPLFPWHQVMPQINLINIGSHAKQYE
nr:N-acetylmuramoyl-L-alanine amidase [Marinicella sp. NBU2979]